MANKLANAASPYLRQHADNPVDWYEWGEHAFEDARRRDVPIFLSVGYSSCHWCHVMAHESFEDPEVAAVLNERFVPVKVDREERPDVDSVYMAAVQALTGRGGWPMSVFLTPGGEPFFAGTYWPRDRHHGMPGFLDVLAAVGQAWTDQRASVRESSAQITAHLRAANAVDGAGGRADADLARRAAAAVVAAWDRRLGGFGAAPKFPQAATIDFLLAFSLRTERDDPGLARQARDAALHTLTAMSRGGIYDHVGGGFARYSVDDTWLVPHFEKMLYDNALLLRAYTHAWQVSGQRRFRRVASETADYLLAEMRHDAGGFFSATDADSEGVEGKFFTWPADEFDAAVTAAGQDPGEFRAFYGVTDAGNFTDPHRPDAGSRSILHEAGLHEAGLHEAGLHEAGHRDEDDEAFTARLDDVRAALYERRSGRVPPGLDDKVLTSWNALALGALGEAGVTLGERRYIDAARGCAAFLRDALVVDGRLRHSWSPGHGATVDAFAEDVAFLARALLVLYEADPDPAWLEWAQVLAADADERFAETGPQGFTGAYFATAHDAEPLLTRPKDLWDDATPSPASVMVEVHLRLAALTGQADHAERAETTLRLFAPRAERAPTGYGELLRGLERPLAGPQEVAVVGTPDDPATRALADVYHRRWRPGSVLAVGPPGSDRPPLLVGRDLLGGLPAAYVCRHFACDRPVTDPASLQALLDGQPAPA